MVRSAAMMLAAVIIPEIALAQEAQGNHTVTDGDTLWDLTEQYYDDPFDWRRIWDANRAGGADPNLILPGQVLVIPGTEPTVAVTAEVTDVAVESPDPVGPADIPTILVEDRTVVRGGVVRAGGFEYLAVPRDLVFSAPWLTCFEGDPAHTGVLEGSAGGTNRGVMVRSHERVRVAMDVPARVGEQLQIFAVDYAIGNVGRVVHPTGVLTVSTVVDGGVIGVIINEYGRIQPGHFVGPMPVYDLSIGEHSDPVRGGGAAMVMGFATGASMQTIGQVTFLDVGTDDGIALGDEFTLYNSSDTDAAEGVLQAVGLADETSAARVMTMRDAVFEQGVVVRLTKKVR
jgi:hypothetical protein